MRSLTEELAAVFAEDSENDTFYGFSEGELSDKVTLSFLFWFYFVALQLQKQR